MTCDSFFLLYILFVFLFLQPVKRHQIRIIYLRYYSPSFQYRFNSFFFITIESQSITPNEKSQSINYEFTTVKLSECWIQKCTIIINQNVSIAQFEIVFVFCFVCVFCCCCIYQLTYKYLTCIWYTSTYNKRIFKRCKAFFFFFFTMIEKKKRINGRIGCKADGIQSSLYLFNITYI